MTENEKNKQIKQAAAFAEEMRQIILSACEDIKDSEPMTEAWDKVDKCYHDLDAMRNRQKCTGAKSFSIMENDGGVDGHTKYLQGISLPIKINSVIEDGQLIPSDVSEMHIGSVDGETAVIITPEIVG